MSWEVLPRLELQLVSLAIFLRGPHNQRALGGPRGGPLRQFKVSFGVLVRRDHLRLAFFSRASRSAVRFFAAAVAAILARAERSSGVMVSRLFLPPREPSSAITCRIMSRETRFAMTSIIRISPA